MLGYSFRIKNRSRAIASGFNPNCCQLEGVCGNFDTEVEQLSVSNVHSICIQKCYVKAQKVQDKVYQSFLNWSWIIQIKHKRVVLTLQGFSSDCHKQ